MIPSWLHSFSQKIWWILPCVLLIIQVPFLQADPDLLISPSRDAFSDEGLNTSQIRNFINGYDLNTWECDNLIKNPLFNVLLAPFLYLFGTHWLTARLTVLIFCLLLLGLSIKWSGEQKYWIGFLFVGLLEYHLFQYMHFSMAEFPAIACILLSIVLWMKAMQENDSRKKTLLIGISTLISACAWWMKIQFAYIVFLLPFSTLIYLIFIDTSMTKDKWKWMGWQVLAIMITLIIYLVCWYFPTQEAWDFLIGNQTTDRFPAWEFQDDVIIYNTKIHFLETESRIYFYTWITSFILSISLLFFKHKNKSFLLFFIPVFIWNCIEIHKIFIHHVPGRYLVSSMAAMGLLIAVVGVEILNITWHSFQEKKPLKRWIFYMVLLMLLMLTYNNGITYLRMWKERSFTLSTIHHYFEQAELNNQTVVGAWSPGLTWGTKAQAIPVWKNFLNDRNILQTLNPRIIFSELKEEESDGAFTADGIDLLSISDSTQQWKVGKWTVKAYWINPDIVKTNSLTK